MGNVISKMCMCLSYPVKYYERRKIEKIYKEVFQDEQIWDAKINGRDITI